MQFEFSERKNVKINEGISLLTHHIFSYSYSKSIHEGLPPK